MKGPRRPGANRGKPHIISHRGASGYRPEQTIASFELAARLGADYLEPDLVTTSDGVLITRHEPVLGETTDVATRPEFADRRTTKVIDGEVLRDEWFAEDFTFDEIKILRAREPMPHLRQQNTIYDGRCAIPSFAEVIDLTMRLSIELGRDIGLYPETKHPTYFQQLDLPLEPALVGLLESNGLNRPDATVYVQSFEVTNLVKLRDQLDVPFIQLTCPEGAPYDRILACHGGTYRDMMTPEGLAGIATYAQGIGPDKQDVIPRLPDGSLGEPTSLIADAHAVGLEVHPYIFRAENAFLPIELRSSQRPSELGDLFGKIETFVEAGVDGLFVDQPDIAVEALGGPGRHAPRSRDAMR
ncbi:glycerophosphodiester phosphodiesterase family protein [Haloechinothrix sp. LS1_15]|uniref:glycerophosphodiester phosphodiesterase family protein n=1 Tax=Haloechinothrix sp. LS1_15 TaxID=2652248 RepID=UPI0029467A3E|nr:glycerophosphodiester phosphodiesterase family protein [Haloechinothrix sp. LS1_15]MDV6011179.1 glycerophosphodiester phosphodiesterase [Haloechinothrix sp. LS1_15]